MKRQTLLGLLFLLIGVVVIGAAVFPVLAHQPIAIWPLVAGIALSVFGAWLIPSSGAGPVVNQIIVTLGNTNLPFLGGRRAGDNPSPPKDGAP
jgi:hypothetical protein